MAPVDLLEAGVFALGVDLPKDRGVERRVGRRAAWAAPQPLLGHRFDHRLAVHWFARLGQHYDRRLDLAQLLGVHRGCRFRRLRLRAFGRLGGLLLAGGLGLRRGHGSFSWSRWKWLPSSGPANHGRATRSSRVSAYSA